MKTLTILSFFFVFVGAMASAPTVSEAAEKGFHKHDGFYLRLTTGVGYNSSDFKNDAGSLTMTGVAGQTTLGIGYAIMENFILNADLFGNVVSDPTVEMGGESVELSASLQNTGIGLGVTYYIMPVNIYVTGGFGAAMTSLDLGGGMQGDTDTGWGLNAAAGKEWWVSANWGIGAALQFFYMDVPGAHSGSVSTWSAGLLFSATYN